MSPEVIQNLYHVRTFKIKKNKLFEIWLNLNLNDARVMMMSWSEFEQSALNGTLTCLGKPVILID